MHTNATFIENSDLAQALRVGAAGWAPHVAAIELLLAHDVWPQYLEVMGLIDRNDPGGELMAWISWLDAVQALDSGDLYASASAERILRIAASLAGCARINLCNCLSGLDPVNADLVSQAVLTCAQALGEFDMVRSSDSHGPVPLDQTQNTVSEQDNH